MVTQDEIDQILTRMSISVRNNTLETAARVARLYGAPEEACERILMLRGSDHEVVR